MRHFASSVWRACTIGLVASLVAVPVALAQDLSPVIDPAQVGQAQVLSAMVRNHGRIAARSSNSTATAAQIRACAKKGQFRAQYGAAHPKVQRLYDLCSGIGR